MPHATTIQTESNSPVRKNNTYPNSLVVIILTYNQKTKTLVCLSNLLNNSDIRFKILVWDNGSQDDTLAAVKDSFPDVLTYYSATNLGVAGGRNASAQLAIHELGATHILFLDNDILVEPGFVGALYEPFEAYPNCKKPVISLCTAGSQKMQKGLCGTHASYMPARYSSTECDTYELRCFWQQDVDGENLMQALNLWMSTQKN